MLRRGGAVSDLLFLYACTTREIGQLRDVAGALGVSVQAASHTFRGLVRRGLAQARNGRYRPTIAGVDFLHRTLRDVDADVAERLERLHVVATTRALAGAAIPAGASVGLALEDGLLTARPGSAGPSRGVARQAARAGDLVEVERLEGIVPLRPAPVTVLTVPDRRLAEPGAERALAAELGRRASSVLAVHGLEALYLARRAVPRRTVERFGVPALVREASSLGVPATVVVLDRDAPRLLALLDAAGPLGIEIVPLGTPVRRDRAHARARR